MIYYAKLNNAQEIEGFYIEDFYGKELCESLNHINVDEALHSYLLNVGSLMIFRGVKEDRLYTILDKDLFKKVIQPEDTTPQPPSEMDLLKEEVLQQSESMLDMDFRLTSLELGL